VDREAAPLPALLSIPPTSALPTARHRSGEHGQWIQRSGLPIIPLAGLRLREDATLTRFVTIMECCQYYPLQENSMMPVRTALLLTISVIAGIPSGCW
jgi:hypothetical protein